MSTSPVLEARRQSSRTMYLTSRTVLEHRHQDAPGRVRAAQIPEVEGEDGFQRGCSDDQNLDVTVAVDITTGRHVEDGASGM